MKPLNEVRAAVLAACPPLPPRSVLSTVAAGLVAAEDIVAQELVPPFANSAMDGFAVRAADTASAPVELIVVGTIAAGSGADPTVGPGQAVRIMTGAPIPDGADAVVMVEQTTTNDDGTRVTIETVATPGLAVRPAGDDLDLGTPVVTAGTWLLPGHLGLLASVGAREIRVYPRPRVGVLSTGDELVPEGGPLKRGQIRDSNRPALLALVWTSGFEPVDLGLVSDDEAAVGEAIEDTVTRCDALVTSGGVSMGDFDPVKVVLARLAADMAWYQVAIRPAKPFAFGTIDAGERRVPVFGLPGNPVSSLVSFELLARPALRQMAGHPSDRLDRVEVRAVADDESLRRRPDGKVHFVRVVARYGDDGRFHVHSAGGQGSHQLRGLAEANALAVVPDGEGVPGGGETALLLLDGSGLT